jgi:hypothetical protein
MPKISAKSGVILVGGYNVGFDAASYETDHSVQLLDATGFGETWQNYVPGMYTGQMSVNMMWNETTGRANDALLPLSAGHNVTIIPEGYTLGNACLSMYALTANFTPGGANSALLSAGNIVFQTAVDDGGPLPSVVLQHGEITNTLTGTGFVDPTNDAVTARCRGTLHIWTACATDRYVIKIQHSDTLGSNYADLITFTANGSAVTSEVKAVASGTINKFRRVLATRTGAGQTLGLSVSFWHS